MQLTTFFLVSLPSSAYAATDGSPPAATTIAAATAALRAPDTILMQENLLSVTSRRPTIPSRRGRMRLVSARCDRLGKGVRHEGALAPPHPWDDHGGVMATLTVP
ncbi:hypothetical protein GCM10023347_26780 [Streptomyces chumphonensis]